MNSKGVRAVMFAENQRKYARLALLVSLTLLACGSAFAQDVHYNSVRGIDFSKYHTYKWVDPPEILQPNEIILQDIKMAIDRQLTQKGLTKTDGDKADLYVSIQCGLHQEKQWNGFGDAIGPFGPGRMATGTITSSTSQQGSIVLNMYDPATKQLVWTGQATKTLDPSNNQEKDLKKLDKAMAKLLKYYPPPF